MSLKTLRNLPLGEKKTLFFSVFIPYGLPVLGNRGCVYEELNLPLSIKPAVQTFRCVMIPVKNVAAPFHTETAEDLYSLKIQWEGRAELGCVPVSGRVGDGLLFFSL